MSNHVTHNGIRYPLEPIKGIWRIRRRTSRESICHSLGVTNLRLAKQKAIEFLEGHTPAKASRTTLEDLAKVYLDTPKKTTPYAASVNVSRLRGIVRAVLGVELGKAQISELGPDLWTRFQTLKQGGSLDLTTRRPENVAINAAVRQARALLIPAMRSKYRAEGIRLPDDCAEVTWLPEPRKLAKSAVNETSLESEWRKLPRGPLWLAVGLARFAGLRRSEIAALRRNWIVESNGSVSIELRDRPEEGFYSKTGEEYRALVIDSELAEYLTTARGQVVDEFPRWFEREPQAWLKPFVGGAKKPLHRLRALYADDVARLTRDAITAQLEGIKAASAALGHTDTATTTKHYLSDALR